MNNSSLIKLRQTKCAKILSGSTDVRDNDPASIFAVDVVNVGSLGMPNGLLLG